MLANYFVRMILVGLALAGLAPGALLAQTPAPKTEAELLAAGNKPLTGRQISKLLLGNTIYVTFLAPIGIAPAGTQYTAFYRDAKTRLVLANSGPTAFKTFEANWWIEGDHVCHEAQVVRQGNQCQSLYQTSSGVYQCRNGNCHVLFRVVPGNPEKL